MLSPLWLPVQKYHKIQFNQLSDYDLAQSSWYVNAQSDNGRI